MHLHSDHLRIVEQKKLIHLHHGDGLIKSDIGYRFLKAAFRNGFNQRVYKMLHPDIGVSLAKFFSSTSRHVLRRTCTERAKREYRERARQYMAQGSDIVVFAHTHAPEIHRYGEKVHCNTGEWIRRYTFGRLIDGHMDLCEYFPDGSSQVLPASCEKPGSSAS
jgi:UDP-2,3-diacylglucosamine hydrolase